MYRSIEVPQLFVLILLSLLLISCDSENRSIEPAVNSPDRMAISGMDMIDESSYLAVYDLKSFEEGNRIGILELSAENGINVYPVSVSEWKHMDGAGSDLESVCSLPNRNNEFLIAESGKWDGKYGRMFHISLQGTTGNYHVTVLGTIDIPEFDAKGPDDSAGDEIEGLACYSKDDNTVGVVFGERGGSEAYPQGLLRWAEADLTGYELNWTAAGKEGVPVNAPGNWVDGTLNRDISGLHIDKNNDLWAVSSEELGDNGPFSSIIYQVGTVYLQEPDPILVLDSLIVYKRMDGFKAEGLSGGTELIPGSRFSIGTEDEQLGGTWRVIN